MLSSLKDKKIKGRWGPIIIKGVIEILSEVAREGLTKGRHSRRRLKGGRNIFMEIFEKGYFFIKKIQKLQIKF